jgi:acyl carrier protein
LLGAGISAVFAIDLEEQIENDVRDVIKCAVERLNELLPFGRALPNDDETVLLGHDGRLDSMGFVNLIVALEDEYSARFGHQIVLTDELGAGDGVRTLGDVRDILIRASKRTHLGNERTAGDMTG